MAWTTWGQWIGLVAVGAALQAITPSPAEAQSAGTLTVRLLNLRSSSGRVGCSLFNSPAGFPSNSQAALQRLWCPIDKAGATSTCAFNPMPAGTYAVACFHDENANGLLDTGLFGIPTEGTVTSNHAKGFMGPPAFSDARFAFSGTATDMPLRMGY